MDPLNCIEIFKKKTIFKIYGGKVIIKGKDHYPFNFDPINCSRHSRNFVESYATWLLLTHEIEPRVRLAPNNNFILR